MAQGQENKTHAYMTYGPTDNEVAVAYATNGGAHNIVFADKVSPDLVLMHQVKTGGFYRKVNAAVDIQPAPRSIKDLILRDTYTKG